MRSRRRQWTKLYKSGASAITERQKHIRVTDLSEYHWWTVEAYKSGGIADNEEDAKKLKQADKSTEQGALKEKQRELQLQHWPKQNGLLHYCPCHFCGPQPSCLDTSLGQCQWEGHHLWLIGQWGHVFTVDSWGI